MKILVTGAKGFVGKNLVENLKTIRDGKNKTRPNLFIEKIYEYDLGDEDKLDEYCADADFVFNLAGVNRPLDKEDFMKGNFGFASLLLDTLKKHHNKAPIMLSSSIQATLQGRFGDSEYGKSKLAGEQLFFNYAKENDVKVAVYRFPNLFGKWCRPNYNSVVATFCDAFANDKGYKINDRNTELELLYIDDLIEGMLDLLEGKEKHCDFNGLDYALNENGKYCCVPVTYKVTLGEIVDLLERFKEQPQTLVIPSIPNNSFSKKLYSTYLSYLPKDKMLFSLKMNTDNRGSFTELLKFFDGGQLSVNISKPGMKKGMHWHNTKWEFFVVVSGKALIKEKNLFSDEIIEFTVDGQNIQAVQMIPGYVHSIENISEKEDLVTIMWANESFDLNKPDTFYENI